MLDSEWIYVTTCRPHTPYEFLHFFMLADELSSPLYTDWSCMMHPWLRIRNDCFHLTVIFFLNQLRRTYKEKTSYLSDSFAKFSTFLYCSVLGDGIKRKRNFLNIQIQILKRKVIVTKHFLFSIIVFITIHIFYLRRF